MTKSSTDKILDAVGTAAVFAPMFLTGAPSWVLGIAALVAYLTGKASSPGVPFRNSAKTPKPDARGQIPDAELPR